MQLIVGVYECSAWMSYLCTMCIPGAHRSQKMESDPPEMELEMVVSRHVCAVKQTQFYKNKNAHHWAISPVLILTFLHLDS